MKSEVVGMLKNPTQHPINTETQAYSAFRIRTSCRITNVINEHAKPKLMQMYK